MKKRIISLLLCMSFVLSFISAIPFIGVEASATAYSDGKGTIKNPYVIKTASELSKLLGEFGSETVYIRLGADISDSSLGPVFVRGKKQLDLYGHTIDVQLEFATDKTDFSLFIVASGASFTVEDSVGGGEIIYDREIPDMDEYSITAPVILDCPLTVFAVNGALTVNGGEITAGHYKSQYYTYTHNVKYDDSQTTTGSVNSITPGNAVVVNAGGVFTSNGGEYYGRGFTIDDNSEKAYTCSAVVLNAKATAVINGGDFYGKSNADVFSVSDEASVTVFAGNFYARYDNRITFDKCNGIAYYVNADCGQIGIPLRAFHNGKTEYTHIFVNAEKYIYKTDFSKSENAAFVSLGSDGTGTDVTVENLTGDGTSASPYRIKYVSDLQNLFAQSGSSFVYIRLENDFDDCPLFLVNGNIVLDLNGHLLKDKLAHGSVLSTYSMFIIAKDASLILDDSAGGGEIVYDRRIPQLAECNAYTDLLLYRPLTVFEVNGTLIVNGGEITAGHYESEYYTYTMESKYLSGSTNAGSVNSIVPGYAVVVNSGGHFVSNGGSYYGRGFTLNDEDEKGTACAAVKLNGGAVGIINDGDFYGKSNADVLSVHWGAGVYVYSGTFTVEYNNRVTVNKYDIVTYINADCGQIGIPLRAFNHKMSSRLTIKAGSEAYTFSSDYTDKQNSDFESLGADGTGFTVTVRAKETGVSHITKQDGTTETFEYDPSGHYELVHTDALHFNESFGVVSGKIHCVNYSWKVEQFTGGRWKEAEYENGAPVSNGYLLTTGDRLDLYDLAGYLKDGMQAGGLYRVKAYASETWQSNNT